MTEFSKDLETDRMSHAYIVSGEDTYTRNILMNLIAKMLFCKQKGCNKCKVCLQIDEFTHPDFKVYNTDGKISVKDIETLIEDTYVKSWEGSKKLYFIDNADSLNPLKQNKLLKIFEEPPADVMIFMFTSDEASLLQTILSRAKKLYLPRFSTNSILLELINEGVSKDVAESCAVFSDGRFDKAFKFSKEEDYTNIYEESFDMLLTCSSTKQMINMVDSRLFERENIELTFEFFEIIFRDVLEYVSKGDNFITLNRIDDIKKLATGFEYSPGAVAKCIFLIADAKQLINVNVTALALAEKLIYNILEEKHKCRLS
jgi:DNA polymerase-3 subunit delta'